MRCSRPWRGSRSRSARSRSSCSRTWNGLQSCSRMATWVPRRRERWCANSCSTLSASFPTKYFCPHSGQGNDESHSLEDRGYPQVRESDAEVGLQLRHQEGHSARPPQTVRGRLWGHRCCFGDPRPELFPEKSSWGCCCSKEALAQRGGQLPLRQLLLLISSSFTICFLSSSFSTSAFHYFFFFPNYRLW